MERLRSRSRDVARVRRGTVLTFTVYILHTGHAACCLYSFHLALATPCASAHAPYTAYDSDDDLLESVLWGLNIDDPELLDKYLISPAPAYRMMYEAWSDGVEERGTE